MTTTAALYAHESENYYCIDEDDGFELEPIVPPRVRRSPRGLNGTSLTERWQYTDTISELVDELQNTGRQQEAAAVKRVLGHDDDEAAMRAYVSRLWAEDWDSPEDAIYDD
jgi:hypothetical protein